MAPAKTLNDYTLPTINWADVLSAIIQDNNLPAAAEALKMAQGSRLYESAKIDKSNLHEVLAQILKEKGTSEMLALFLKEKVPLNYNKILRFVVHFKSINKIKEYFPMLAPMSTLEDFRYVSPESGADKYVLPYLEKIAYITEHLHLLQPPKGARSLDRIWAPNVILEMRSQHMSYETAIAYLQAMQTLQQKAQELWNIASIAA